jgi:hypothetical protein
MHSEMSWHAYEAADDPGRVMGGCYASCSGDVTVMLGPAGLTYAGFCCAPAYGGGFTIGTQPVDEFLDSGPLRPLPADIVEEIRAYLAEHRTATATLELVAVVTDPGRRLVRVDAELDGAWITAGRPLPDGSGDSAAFHTGTVPVGDHQVGAAFVTEGGVANVTQSPDVAFAVAEGERLRIVFTVTGPTTSIAMTREPNQAQTI